MKPIVFLGKEGITDAFIASLMDAFNTRELLKLKVQQMAPDDAREAGTTLVERIEDLHVIQVIGRTIVLYHPHPEHPKIKLPERGRGLADEINIE